MRIKPSQCGAQVTLNKCTFEAYKYIIVRRGKHVILSRPSILSEKPVGGKRGIINEYSQASRLRLLKIIAEINWGKLPMGYFVTLTYPDNLASVAVGRATMQRHHWIRNIEKAIKEKMPMMWRKEYKDRQSGEHEGKLVHHYHVVVFTECDLTNQMANECWMRALQTPAYVNTDVKVMTSGEHAAFYLAKYMGKRESSPLLGNAAYLTKPGRAWGIHRRNMLPFEQTLMHHCLTPYEFDELMVQAHGLAYDGQGTVADSVTLLGDRAIAFWKSLENKVDTRPARRV